MELEATRGDKTNPLPGEQLPPHPETSHPHPRPGAAAVGRERASAPGPDQAHTKPLTWTTLYIWGPSAAAAPKSTIELLLQKHSISYSTCCPCHSPLHQLQFAASTYESTASPTRQRSVCPSCLSARGVTRCQTFTERLFRRSTVS